MLFKLTSTQSTHGPHELNGDKFECLRYGTNQELQNSTSYKSNSRSTIQEKDAGIIMGNDATFKVHIGNAITEGQRQCTWILRTFSTRHLTPMLTLWKSVVQSSQLWCPLTKDDIQAVEMVQRQFLRRIPSMRNLSYW